MKRKKITMRNALLIFCITSVVFALLADLFVSSDSAAADPDRKYFRS